LEELANAEPRGKQIEIWFADEARIGQKNKITRRWAKRGTRPSAPKPGTARRAIGAFSERSRRSTGYQGSATSDAKGRVEGRGWRGEDLQEAQHF